MSDALSAEQVAEPCEFVPPHEPWTCKTHDGFRTSLNESQCDVAAAARLAALPAKPDVGERLDAAWAEAEAALPEGWTMLVGREINRPYAYWATASGPRDPETRAFSIVSTSRDGTLELTPAAALRALRAALTEQEAGRE